MKMRRSVRSPLDQAAKSIAKDFDGEMRRLLSYFFAQRMDFGPEERAVLSLAWVVC